MPGVENEGGINWLALPFDRLSGGLLYRVLALRSAVFVVEQECLHLDMDGLDLRSTVVLGVRSWGATGYADASWHDVVATARILPPGVGFPDPSIGRLCVSNTWRGQGLGRILLRQAVKACAQQFPGMPIRMSAQAHLQKFCRAAGFRMASEVYLENHIPHIEMVIMPQASAPALLAG